MKKRDNYLEERATKYIYQYIKYEHVNKYIAEYFRKKLVYRYGIWIGRDCKIGEGLILPHPQGIVIGNGVHIGKNVTLFQQVTLGKNRGGVSLYRIRDGNLSRCQSNRKDKNRKKYGNRYQRSCDAINRDE